MIDMKRLVFVKIGEPKGELMAGEVSDVPLQARFSIDVRLFSLQGIHRLEISNDGHHLGMYDSFFENFMGWTMHSNRYVASFVDLRLEREELVAEEEIASVQERVEKKKRKHEKFLWHMRRLASLV